MKTAEEYSDDVTKWEPPFYAEIDENAEDSDYLRKQGCCSVCGAYIADLPGYYWIESDDCPNCACDRTEKWSEELKRVKEYYDIPAENIDEEIKAAEEMGI